jgi:hypothetical protein
MRWVEGLKIWNGRKGGAWCVPRKGTPEHAEVKAIMAGEKKVEKIKPRVSEKGKAMMEERKVESKKEKVKGFLKRAVQKYKEKKSVPKETPILKAIEKVHAMELGDSVEVQSDNIYYVLTSAGNPNTKEKTYIIEKYKTDEKKKSKEEPFSEAEKSMLKERGFSSIVMRDSRAIKKVAGERPKAEEKPNEKKEQELKEKIKEIKLKIREHTNSMKKQPNYQDYYRHEKELLEERLGKIQAELEKIQKK